MTLFGKRIFADVICWGSQDDVILDLRLDLNPVFGVLIRGKKGTQRWSPYEDKGRDWSDVLAATQGIPRDTRIRQQEGRSKAVFSLEPWERQALSTPWSQISSLPNCEQMHFCCLKIPTSWSFASSWQAHQGWLTGYQKREALRLLDSRVGGVWGQLSPSRAESSVHPSRPHMCLVFIPIRAWEKYLEAPWNICLEGWCHVGTCIFPVSHLLAFRE